MNTITQQAISYRGYTIEVDYPNPYSNTPQYMYYPAAEGPQHDADYEDESYHYTGNCKWADSIEEAKDQIWEKIMTSMPQHRVVMNRRDYFFYWIEDAIKFAVQWNAEEFHPAITA